MDVAPGDFKSLPLSQNDIEMLQDAYDTISALGAWEFFKSYSPENGFMFSPPHGILQDVNEALKFQGHSGASYGWTMRVMQFIARFGWKKYANDVLVASGAQSVSGESVAPVVGGVSPVALANALESADPVRFAGQANAMAQFANGTLTYAQMRELCG
jgi:hypothetical protein